MPTVIYMMATGKMTKLKGMDCTRTLMEHSMKVNGLMINNMVREKRLGLMEHNMRVIINLVKKTVMEIFFGQINQVIAAILSTTI